MTITASDLGLRLRKFLDENVELGMAWYADPVVLAGAVSPDQKESLPIEYLRSMYADLRSRGDLYIIEVNKDGEWHPIGEVTLSENSLPIVIGDPNYRGQKIAGKVIQILIEEARSKGWEKLKLKGIYKGNISSQRVYEACGFKKTGETPKCYIYELMLQ